MGLLLNDEWITANQLTNLKHGSLTVEVIKYGTDRGIYNISGRPVGAYTHALPVFALPVYYALSAVAHIINLRLFFILVWLLAVSALIYYYSGTKRTKYVLAILALLFFAANLLLYFFPSLYGFWSFLHHPLEFTRWGEIAAINISRSLWSGSSYGYEQKRPYRYSVRLSSLNCSSFIEVIPRVRSCRT